MTEYTVGLLFTKMCKGDFVIPLFRDTWNHQHKSKFIESLILGLPIPFLYFCEKSDIGKLEVVDGLQRLQTINQFINNELILGELSKLDKLKGFKFNDLTSLRQQKIKNRSIRGIMLTQYVNDQTKIYISNCVNTTKEIKI